MQETLSAPNEQQSSDYIFMRQPCNNFYIALAIGMLRNYANGELFAFAENLTSGNIEQSNSFAKIAGSYNNLREPVEQAFINSATFFPTLANLYSNAIGDKQVTKAVIISLVARQLTIRDNVDNCHYEQFAEANKIFTDIETYIEQETLLNTMVAMILLLNKKPLEYQIAVKHGGKVKNSKRFKPLNANSDMENQIRLLLTAAQHIAEQAEKDCLSDTHMIFLIKKQLQQEVSDKLADIITTVYAASCFGCREYTKCHKASKNS